MTPKHERETLDALERLGAASASVRAPESVPADVGVSRGRAKPDAANEPAKHRAEDAVTLARYRCLTCGYPLMVSGETRCSECGRQYAVATLENWYSGAEEQRLDLVMWLIRLSLGLKVLLIPVVLGFFWSQYPSIVWLGDLAAVVWMLWFAMRGRVREIGARYAIIGLHLAAILIWFELQVATEDRSPMTGGLPSAYAASEAACGLLLLMALHRRETGIVLPGSVFLQRLCIFGLVSIAPVAFVVNRLVTPGTTLSGQLFGSGGMLVAPGAIAFVLNVGVWLFIWWRIYRLRRILFGRRDTIAA